MKIFVKFTAVVVATIIVTLSGATQSVADFQSSSPLLKADKSWSTISFKGRSGVPRGYYDLCISGNSICRTHGGKFAKTSSGAVRLTSSLLTIIASVNTSVNRSMHFVYDSNDRDRWTAGVGKGDCEDFALTKKRRLISAGFPSSSLVVALGKTRTGTDHAVLIVRTDRGDLVLDNLSRTVRPWSSSMYRWHSIQSPRNTWTWHKLG